MLRKLLPFFLFCCILNVSHAQDLCGFNMETHVVQPEFNPYQNRILTTGTTYIPIHVNWVRNTNGTFSVNSDLSLLVHQIGISNRLFSNYGVQFYLGKITYINNTDYLYFERVSNTTELNTITTTYRDPNFVNIWIVDGWSDNGVNASSTGFASPLGMYFRSLQRGIFVHELGHFLGLKHTFDTETGIEKVSRSANCSTAGDGFCDTHADPFGLIAGQYNGQPYTNNGYSMTSTTRDLDNNLYTPPFDNIMSYYFGKAGHRFSPQQFDYMVNYIAQNLSSFPIVNLSTNSPSSLTVTSVQGIPTLSWSNSSSTRATQIEYSIDNQTTWKVLDFVMNSTNQYALSGIKKNQLIYFRVKPLDAYNNYSNVISFTPTYSIPPRPIQEIVLPSDLAAIGVFEIPYTNIKNLNNLNEGYTINKGSNYVELVKGGTYRYQIKTKETNNNHSITFFYVYLDENNDGDFDDVNELKYSNNTSQYNFFLDSLFNISANSQSGPTILRVRTSSVPKASNPLEYYVDSETEDYIVTIREAIKPTNLQANLNLAQASIDLTWSDNSTLNYQILRSTDGVNFTVLDTAFQSTTYTDPIVSKNRIYYYRVTRLSENAYVETTVTTFQLSNINYCVPTSTVSCTTGYGITNFSFPSLSWSNVQSDFCPNANGYTYFSSLPNLTFQAGQQYNFSITNTMSFSTTKHVKIYLDTNQDGVFSNSELLYSGQDINSGSITIPSGTINGETRLRVRAFLNPITSSCSEVNYGETEDYKIFITNGKDGSLTNVAYNLTTQNQLNITWVLPANLSSTATVLELSTDGINYNTIANLNIPTSSYLVTTLVPSTEYYLRIKLSQNTNNESHVVKFSTNSTTTSLLSSDIVKCIQVYPNPSKQILYVSNCSDLNYHFNLLDVKGTLLQKGDLDLSTNIINVENLPNGLYLFKVINNEGAYFVYKIIKE